MGSFKDLGRLINGLSLVAKEILRRSETLGTAANNNGNLETLITSTLKKAVVSATDLSGLTKGKVRHFSNPNSSSTSSNHDSVVYFTPEAAAITAAAQEQAPDLEFPATAQQTVVPEVVNTTAEDVFATPALPPDQSESENVTADDVFATPALPPNQSESRNVTADDVFATPALPPNQVESQNVPSEGNAVGGQVAKITPAVPVKRRTPRERRVPSTPFSRALGFAGLGAGLAWGTVQESAKRLVYGTPDSKDKQSAVSPFLSEKNAERLALALCRMRGAALKLGQMLSIQDESLVPAPILAALDIVRQGADVMPRSQLNQVLDGELGPNWSSKLISFDYEPLAAASIGQVHRAVMKDGLQVAMKIQYPGVADSIESDIENCKLLLDYTNLIPEGLYLDSAMKVAKEELSRECDYELEALNQKRFRDLLANRKGVYVPIVVDEISSKRVLTTEFVAGIPIDKVALLNQETRNYVGKTLLELTLMELFVFRFMQTDPNWGNFLYDETTTSINLIDFGAARDYPKSFVDDYLRMVIACANGDGEAVIEMSRRLGFLTGMESEIMLDAHVQAGFVVGLPFSKTGGYDFRSTNITQSISNLGATMLRHRLTPPPDEAYSLHRKLSGAFLACIKLGAVVPCRELLLEVYEQYQFGEDGGEVLSSSSVS